MRLVSLRLAAILVLALTVGCSSTRGPSVRVRNDRATKANVQFKDASANTTNINDVSAGTVSGYTDIAPGAYTVTAVIQNESVSPTTTFTALNGTTYTLVVVSGTTPALRVDQP